MKKYACLVGLNYLGTDSQLEDCYKDVEDVSKLLTSYNSVEEYKEFNLKDLITYVNKINNLVTINDTVLFMYSGHGTQISEKPKTEGLVFHKDNKITIVKDKDFVSLIDSIKCNVIVFCDACFSEGFQSILPRENIKFRAFKEDDIIEPYIQISKSKSITKKIGFYSSSNTETSESTGSNGLFVQGVIKSLNGKSKSINLVYKDVIKHCEGKQTPKLVCKGLSKTTKIF
jgi:hypothetical protein